MKVHLNVYDLHNANNYGYFFGIGVFHSGVEIGGKEYCFGGHEFSDTGVFDVEPRLAPGARFREAILLGETALTQQEIQKIVDELSADYAGNSYNPLTRNCNTFSDELCFRVLGIRIPSYVNRLANFGSAISCIFPSSGLRLLGIAPPTSDMYDDSNDLSNVNSPSNFNSDINSPKPVRRQTFIAFSGTGNPLGDSDDGEGFATFSLQSDELRREKAANAAYKRMGNITTFTTTTIATSSDDGE